MGPSQLTRKPPVPSVLKSEVDRILDLNTDSDPPSNSGGWIEFPPSLLSNRPAPWAMLLAPPSIELEA